LEKFALKELPLFLKFETDKYLKTIVKMKPTPRELQETYKTHSQLVEHLIAEGYADDNESANKIIEGMSETWFNLIVND
jgi:hypothetical protein